MAKVKLEFILFGVLLQQPQTGYELQRFMETTGRFMRPNTSMTQIYRSVRKMDEDGWLSHQVEARQGAKDAKRYSVTDTGRQVFHSWLAEPYEPPSSPNDPAFGTHLRFRAQYLGRQGAIDMLTIEIDYRQEQIGRNRYRDRTEWYDPDAGLDLELTGSIMNWEHQRGAGRMDNHLAEVIALRDTLLAGQYPLPDEPIPLQSAPVRNEATRGVQI